MNAPQYGQPFALADNIRRLLLAVLILATSALSAEASEYSDYEIEQVGDLTIAGKINSGEYRSDFADSATKTFTHNLDIPQPVDVVNTELMESQLAERLDDVYRNAAAVDRIDPLDHTSIRGFRLNENSGGILKNGLREVSQGFTSPSLANVEKVEILKGTSSALYGRGEPGGIINLITKKPQLEHFTTITASAASHDAYQLNLDHNNVVNDDLQWRLNLELNDENSYRDDVSRKRQFIAPVISYQINPDQKLTAELELNHFRQSRDTGVAVINGNLYALPPERNLGGDTEVDAHIYAFQLSHEWFLSPDWLLNSKVRLSHDSTDDELFFPFDATTQAQLNGAPVWQGDTDTRIYRSYTTAEDNKDELNLDINLAGEVDGPGGEHHLLFGLNLNHRNVKRNQQIYYNDTLRQTLNAIDPALAVYSYAAWVDPFAPQNSASLRLPGQLAAIPGLNSSFDYTDRLALSAIDAQITSTGLYVQDQLRLTQHWQLVAGARYDHTEYDVKARTLDIPSYATSNLSWTTSEAHHSADTLVPRLGLVFQPQANISIYTSYGKQFDIAVTADKVHEINAHAGELGVKWDLNPGLNASLAYFEINKTNQQEFDNLAITNVIDQFKSKGFELSLQGHLSPHWVISANYAEFEALITEDRDNPDNEGNRVRGTPTYSGSLWLQHNFTPDGVTGLSLAAGANRVGPRPIDNANSANLPGYTLYDAMLTYRASKNLRLRFKVENLTDERWFIGSLNSQSAFPGQGRTARLSVDYRF